MAFTFIGVPRVEKNGCGAIKRTLLPRLLLVLLGGIFALKLSLTLYISLDEFTYTHAAWLVSTGKVPYRDFPLFHPPLLEIILSPIFLINNSSIFGILAPRVIFGIILLGTALLIDRETKTKSGVGFVLALTFSVFSTWMLEVRPDSLALFLFLLAGVELSGKRLLVGAILIALSLLSSEKALVYVPAIAVPLIVSRDWKTLVRLVLLSLVFSGIALLILIGTIGLWPLVEFLINWALRHESQYPEINPWRHISEYAVQFAVLIGLSAVAINKDVKESLKWVILFSLGAVSYFLQRGPFAYSLLPMTLPLIVLASRGIEAGLEKFKKPELLTVALALLIVPLIIFVPGEEVTNEKQLKALELLDQKVASDDCIYDNSGFSVTRSHAHYWYFTDQLIRDLFMTRFEVEVPAEIERRGCSAMVKDERFYRLSEKLKGELRGIFPVCEGMVCFRK